MRASLVRDEEFHDIVRFLIAGTTERLDLCTFIFDLMPDSDVDLAVRRLAHMLKDAADDGVRVRVMVSQPERGVATISNVAAVLYCAEIGLDCRLAPREAAMHAKYMICDQVNALIGGHNLSRRSLETNRDISLLIKDADRQFIKDIERDFDRVWNTCEAMSLDSIFHKVS